MWRASARPPNMRLPNTAHELGNWRIRDIVSDFTLEDVWAMPVHGGAEDFPALLQAMLSLDPAQGSLPTRVLWKARDLLGSWFGLGRTSLPTGGADDAETGPPIPGTSETSLRDRLPEDLRNTATDVDFSSTPFQPLYCTDVEFAAELSTQTVHGVLHLGWVETSEGRYQGQLAVYVKPRGQFGKAYMAFIKPFRYLVVYPALLRQIETAWKARTPQ